MSTEIVVSDASALASPAGPQATLDQAAAIARALKGVIDQAHLWVELGGKRYVRVEGWTTLGALMGAIVREVSVEERDGVFTATVELVRQSDGAVLSRASAECGAPDEPWHERPRYARRSMAITRAAGKACRLAYSWVMALAGYEPTPAEEVIDLQPAKPQATQPTAKPTTPKPAATRQASEERITDGQLRLIRARIAAAKLDQAQTATRIKTRFQLEHLEDLTRAQLEEVLRLIEEWGKGNDPLVI